MDFYTWFWPGTNLQCTHLFRQKWSSLAYERSLVFPTLGLFLNQAESLIPSSAGLGQSGPFVSFSPPSPFPGKIQQVTNQQKTRLHHLVKSSIHFPLDPNKTTAKNSGSSFSNTFHLRISLSWQINCTMCDFIYFFIPVKMVDISSKLFGVWTPEILLVWNVELVPVVAGMYSIPSGIYHTCHY